MKKVLFFARVIYLIPLLLVLAAFFLFYLIMSTFCGNKEALGEILEILGFLFLEDQQRPIISLLLATFVWGSLFLIL